MISHELSIHDRLITKFDKSDIEYTPFPKNYLYATKNRINIGFIKDTSLQSCRSHK